MFNSACLGCSESGMCCEPSRELVVEKCRGCVCVAPDGTCQIFRNPSKEWQRKYGCNEFFVMEQ